MRKTVAAAVSVLLMLSLAVTAFGTKVNIKIDGDVSDEGWKSATAVTAGSGSTGNRYKSWGAKYVFAGDGYSVYYMLTASLDSPAGSSKVEGADIGNMGIRFTPADCGVFEMSFSGADDDYIVTAEAGDKETWSADGAMKLYPDNGTVIAEIKVTYYDGAPASAGGSVKFYDDLGDPTTAKSFSAVNPDYTTEAVAETEKSTTAKASKTTTEKTTAADEIIISTSRVQTTRRGVRTVTAKTTAAEKTTKEKTTKEKTTSAKTTKAKTTKASAKNSGSETAAEKTPSTEQNVVVITVYDTTETSSSSQNGSAFSLGNISRSTVYKAVTGLCALVLFGVIGVWAVRSRESDGDDKSKDDDEPDGGEDK